MATKIIKAWIDGAVQEIEVEDIVSPEMEPSVEERVDKLEDKHEVVFADGNFLVGNGTEVLEEMTPEEVLSHINGASIATMTTAEFESLEETNANTLYIMTDSDDEGSAGGEGSVTGAVRYDTLQTLNTKEKRVVRSNINSAGLNDIYKTKTTLNFAWDGNTEGRDIITFDYDGRNYTYCKVSDSVPDFDSIYGTISEMTDNQTCNTLTKCCDCYIAGFGIVVEQVGTCLYYLDGEYPITFTAPSTGIYFLYNVDDATIYQKSLLLSASGAVTLSYTWDGNIDGKDTFVYNTNNYYKISDDVFDYEMIGGIISKGIDILADNTGKVYNGLRCYGNNNVIIVTFADGIEICHLPMNNYPQQWNTEFAPVSSGIYVAKTSDDSYVKELNLLVNGKHGIYLNSEANNSFTIGVTDDGTITTEDESGAVTKMIASPDSAEVGQVLSVKSVDKNGNIIWETINPEAAEVSVTTDPTLSIEGSAADAKAVGDVISSIETDINTKVPTTRTINGKALSSDITLTPEDIGVTTETDTTLTISGMAADAKVTGDAIANLNTLVGDSPVSNQITEAIEEAIVEVYVQNDEPTDAPEGSIWVDLDADGAPTTSGKTTANVYVVDARTTDVSTVDFSQYAIGDVVVVTVS